MDWKLKIKKMGYPKRTQSSRLINRDLKVTVKEDVELRGVGKVRDELDLITNDTPASIQIELKAFEQTTNTFRDVLPTKYQDWNQLSKDQSKDFALALLPVPSEGWASLKEGSSSNYDLGEIKAESSVDFTFKASHGRAFVERLNPQYRLSFMFGF